MNQKREAMLLICVLVCLGIAMSITAIAIQSSLRARRQMNHHWQLEQTRAVLDAAVRRYAVSGKTDLKDWDQPWVLDGVIERYPFARATIEKIDLKTDDESADESDLNDFEIYQVTAELKNVDPNPIVTRRSRRIKRSLPIEKGNDDET